MENFKGAHYQKKTEDIKKSSLTCMYTLKSSKTYFDLKLRAIDADNVDITTFNENWDNFYDPSLYSCEGKGIHIGDCKFNLKAK